MNRVGGQGFLKVWDGRSGLFVGSHRADFISCLRGWMQSNVRQHRPAWESAINPHLHLQYAAPPHKQMLPLQSALFLVTPPPTTTSRRPSPYTASMTMQLQAAAGRCRAGCCHSSQWRSAWCLVLFNSNRMQMTPKPAWGRRRRFQNRAHIWNLSFPLITTRLLRLHWVSPRCPTYL